MIHAKMKSNLKTPEHASQLKTEVAYLAQNYVSNYRISASDMKKHRILKNLRNNKDLIILRQDKGSGIVIMDRKVYTNSCKTILNDTTKFKLLDTDPTISRESKLQRTLRNLKSKGCLNDTTYHSIYPNGSQPARFYGLPKIHKTTTQPNGIPPLRPIVSSIGAYNYKLAKYLKCLYHQIFY